VIVSEAGTAEIRPDNTAARARPSVQFVASFKAFGLFRLLQLILPGSVGTMNCAAGTGTAETDGSGAVGQYVSHWPEGFLHATRRKCSC